MPRVTYLFGAGASAWTLPTIKDIPSRLNAFSDYIAKNRKAHSERFENLPCPITEYEGEELLMAACADLAVQCSKHASIDTYAKKLFITGRNEEYQSLKTILTCFFVYEQMINITDPRYDSFLASILGEHHLDYRGDIRILSWNYDYQLEKAYSQYSNIAAIRENSLMLRVFPGGLNIDSAKDEFSVFKINGTTGFRDLQRRIDGNLFPTFEKIEGTKLIERLVWYFLATIKCSNVVESMLSFAWENQNLGRRVAVLCDKIKNSEALVVIGYSFPFFNRDVDREILKALSYFDRAKIYVQDTNPNSVIDRVKSAFPTGKSFEVIPINSTDQFYLPAEL